MISGKQARRRPRTATRLGLAAAAALVLVVGAFGVAAVIAAQFASVAPLRSTPVQADPAPAPAPSEDLGIFASVSGWIVHGDRDGIWGVDPAGPADPATRTQLAAEAGTPLGWSRDGTRLLIMRAVGFGRWYLFVLDADGSQTQVAEPQGSIPGATISPDGSRVVFATYRALYSVDVDGGRPVVLLEGGEGLVYAPTFSPDGTKIAYVVGSGDHSHRVWVMDADGSDTHQILANEKALSFGHVKALAWSPVGDRIALGIEVGTYTFAPDGSGFTQVLTGGTEPYWSPDGSKLAYSKVCPPREDCSLAIANADGSHAREFAINSHSRGSGPWHPGQPAAEPSTPGATNPTPSPTAPVSDELLLQLQSCLFERDLALGLDLGLGNIVVQRADRSVNVAWGEKTGNVSALGMRDQFVDATPAQADKLIELEDFFHDPVAWALRPDIDPRVIRPDEAHQVRLSDVLFDYA